MPTKPREKGPWKGPSHHRNQHSSKHKAPAAHGPKFFTKQKEGCFRREQPFDYFLVIDFECTCEMEDKTWPHEIIEFPAVLMNSSTGAILAEFHRYVKPILRPELTAFCKNLTGIQQAVVDAADHLAVVVADFQRWLELTIPKGSSVCCATDGPTDMEKFMYQMAVKRDGIPFPELLFTYVDVKLTFSKFFKTKAKLKLPTMLRELGLKMEGQHHSGIDDARNIGRLMHAMMDKGCVFQHPLFIRHSEEATVEGDHDSESAEDLEAGDESQSAEEDEASPIDEASAIDETLSADEPGNTKPRVVLHKRNLDREREVNPAVLRRQRINAALAKPEDLAAHRMVSTTTAKPSTHWWHWIAVAFGVVVLSQLFLWRL